jgi:trans-aconitate methyltransferase
MSKIQWDPVQYNKVASFVSKNGEPLIGLLNPQTNHHILDLGCGDATLSLKLAALCKKVTGVDASPEMVASAKSKGLDASVQDAHDLSFDSQFDCVFSNAALHWMNEPKRVLDNVYNALKHEGTFVAEFGGFGNVDTIVDALTDALKSRGIMFTNPWFFPKPEQYSQLLSEAGFAVQHIEHYHRFTPLTSHLHDWIMTFAQSFLNHCTASQLHEVLQEVADKTKEVLFKNDMWHADYVRLRIKAAKL